MSRGKRPDTSLIIGRNPVREALEQRPAEVEKVLLQKGGGGQNVEAIRKLATASGVPFQYVPLGKLNQLAAGLNHQGAVARATPVAYQDVDDMLAGIAPSLDAVQASKPMLLLLDGVEDPYNFGAMLRSAVAAGVGGVIVPKQGMAPFNAAVLKASAGTAAQIPVARVSSMGNQIIALKERGYWVVGADGMGETTLWDMDWDRPVALVMGSEGSGLSKRVADACDYRVSIPLRGPAESLNVSVAAGILLFAAARCRV